jgi:hypothetical protein
MYSFGAKESDERLGGHTRDDKVARYCLQEKKAYFCTKADTQQKTSK